MAITKEESLKQWKDKIKLAEEFRKPFLTDWNYFEQVYDNNLWGKNAFGQRNILTSPNAPVQVNETDAIINNIIPKIAFNYPIFDVEDLVNGNSLAALIYEVYALKLYEVLDMFFVIRDVIFDALLLGGGIHKTGMMYDVELSRYNVEGTQATISGTIPDYITNEMLISVAPSPKNMLWDYNFKNWKDKRWIAEEIIKPLEEVKDSGLYSNTRNLKGNLSIAEFLPKPSMFNRRESQKDMVKLYEIHDHVEGKIITVCPTHDKYLQYDDDYGIDVYDLLEFTPSRPKRFWGKSVVQDIEQHLVRLALANHWMDEDSKSAGRKMYMADSSIGNAALKKVESDDPRAILPIDGLTAMGGDPIREIKHSTNTFQWSTVMGIIERQIRMLTGSTMQERGTHEPGVETATEANMLMQASETRNSDRALILSIFVQKVMTKMLMLASSYVRPNKIAEFIGVDPADVWLVTPFDTMKLTVKFGSTAMEARKAYMDKLITINQLFPDLVNRNGLMTKVMTALGFGLKDQDLFMSAAQPATNTGSNTRPLASEQQTPPPAAEQLPQMTTPF